MIGAIGGRMTVSSRAILHCNDDRALTLIAKEVSQQSQFFRPERQKEEILMTTFFASIVVTVVVAAVVVVLAVAVVVVIWSRF